MNDRIHWTTAHLPDQSELALLKYRLRMEELLFGSVAIIVNEDGVTVIDPATVVTDPPKEKEEKSALDEAKDAAEPKDENGGSKPPEDGPCRECKRLRRLNRLRLCYPCYVDLVLMDEAKKRDHQWKPGDKHPDWCACEGLGEHPERDNGAWRGN